MKKVLFVDHAFHKKTRSADFFTSVLEKRFIVETYWLNPEDRSDSGVLAAAANADVIVLWQMDFLGPVFLSMGKPVIVIPMYDGSGAMPDVHWLFSSEARFFNFCFVLNERIRMAGCESMLLRYFPEPVKESTLPRFDELNAFFWQRRPDSGLTVETINALLGTELDSLHVHDVPDIVGMPAPSMPEEVKYSYTRSTWFESKEDYEECLKKANVFVAPRSAEGIGMALLEAMAQGKLVLAHDEPTHNEYISNWSNGVLFNKDSCWSPISIRTPAASMARLAWRTVVEGRKQWLDSESAILDWVDGAKPATFVAIDHEDFFKKIWRSYYTSLDEYVAVLMGNLSLLSRFSRFSFTKILDCVGEARLEQAPVRQKERDCSLDGSRILDLTRDDDRFIGRGWSHSEKEWRWALGYRAEVYFSDLDITEGTVNATFVASSLPELGDEIQCTVFLNNVIVFDDKISPEWKDYCFSFDAALLRDKNLLIMGFEKASSLPTDSRVLSARLKYFDFTFTE